MLTNAEAKAAGARSRAYKLHDQGGLHLLVRPTGTKSWQMKYRVQGREKLLTLGQFPEVAVPRARILQAEAKELLERGVDPGSRRGQPHVETFEQVARAWHGLHQASWSPAHAADILSSLERDVFPKIGATPIGAIGAPQLLAIVRQVEGRGCLETAGRLRQRLSAIFGYAIAEGLVDIDPAAQLGRALVKGRLAQPMPALTDIEECRALLAACERSGAQPVTVLASRFLALTAVRLDAMRGMRWSEVDEGARLWTVPAARMKLGRAKKAEARFDHLVPLSEAAVAVLHAARQVSIENGYDTRFKGCDAPLVFPGRSAAMPIGAGAIADLYRRAGFAGRHVPHGWRASFSTILNEQLGEAWRADIDRALAHAGKGKVEAAYNRSVLLDRRRELLERWGALLSDI